MAQALPPVTAPAPLGTPPVVALSVNGKKKKKRKGKGKSTANNPYGGEDEYEDDEDDDLPTLEPMNGAGVNGRHTSVSRTGLSPELESVHLSTTASLSASVAAAARLNPAAVAEAELLATADHLARSMDVDPEGGGGGGGNEEYWASFPEHLRNFVRNTYSQLRSSGDEDQKTQAMYAIAQQIHAGAGVNLTANATVRGITRSATARYPPGAFQTSMPFDPSIFTDPAFTLAMEQAAAANGLHPPLHREATAPANVVVLNEYSSDGHEYPEDEYYSEDDLDGIGEAHATEAQFTLSYEENMAHLDATRLHLDEGYDVVDATGRRRKNKKKKRNSVVQPLTPAAPPMPAPIPVSAPNIPAVPSTNLPPPASVPHNRMPAPRPPPAANPPPSSRAAGKQPMSYTAPAPAANPPPPSRRAASKAPITSHAYQHNHAHHHPSPPASNTAAPHKPRPPANGTAQASPAKNSKIWSTSTSEERERIKEFWLGLGEEERRNLVKIEKEAVLKKMKEQQRHSCMCAVCGRKRSVLLVSV